jgi:glycosyltransferase involved in cell wall biosynthesis
MRALERLPPGCIVRVWNGIDATEVDPGSEARVRKEFSIPAGRPIVFCAARAVAEKGVFELLRSFDVLIRDWPAERPRPALLYLGDGPEYDNLLALRDRLSAGGDMFLPGYRDSAADVAGCATVAVVPSLWQEAFGLSALEPMARGRPVIASRVGGLPEIVREGETGLLVPAGDETALCAAMRRLLLNPEECELFGRNSRTRARDVFSMDTTLGYLSELLAEGF